MMENTQSSVLLITYTDDSIKEKSLLMSSPTLTALTREVSVLA